MAIQMMPVESSNIHSVGHDADGREMHVTFKGKDGAPGKTYVYSGVSPDKFQAFMASESKGSHFHQNIKTQHQFRVLGD